MIKTFITPYMTRGQWSKKETINTSKINVIKKEAINVIKKEVILKPERELFDVDQLRHDIGVYFNDKRNGKSESYLLTEAMRIRKIAQNYVGDEKWINKFKNGRVLKKGNGRKYFVFPREDWYE